LIFEDASVTLRHRALVPAQGATGLDKAAYPLTPVTARDDPVACYESVSSIFDVTGFMDQHRR
jgi:hypothetical protein